MCLNRIDSLSYMELMNLLNIKNTGRLNYHLKTLDNLIEKRNDGKYQLTERGQLAVQFLENYPEKVSKTDRSITQRHVMRAHFQKNTVFNNTLLLGA